MIFLDFLEYRSRALASLTILKPKDQPKCSKDELEELVRKNYFKHYLKINKKKEKYGQK